MAVRRAALGALALLAGCAAGGPDSLADSPTLPGGLVEGVTWRLAWDTSRVTMAEAGGWTVTADTGAEVRVDRGWMNTWAAWLEPCATASRRPGLPLGRAAWAHSLADDPSALSEPWVEDLAAPQDVLLDSILFPAARYCGAGLMVAMVLDGARNVPDGLDMVGQSLVLEGAWRADAEADWTPFVWTATAPVSVDLALELEGAGEDGEPVVVTLTRPLGALFDGLDLAEAHPEVLALGVVNNAAGGAVAGVE